MVSETFDGGELIAFATSAMVAVGLSEDRAATVARVLVKGDLLGKSTHGIALLPAYVDQIIIGGMNTAGDPLVISDMGACTTWDGQRLPGPWLMTKAVKEAVRRAKSFGLGAVSLRRSHHTACLGAYLAEPLESGLAILICLTDPSHSSVAPYGGCTPVLTSNPIAFGAPTKGDPILIDMSTAMLTNSAALAYARSGKDTPSPSFLNSDGLLTSDASVISATPPGSILPLGGLEAGHKGYALGLIVELLTGCLSGHGRAETHEGWGASVLVMVFDPGAFGGSSAFVQQSQALVELCQSAKPRPGFGEVSLPGAASLRNLRRQEHQGIVLPPDVVQRLASLAEAHGLRAPTAL